MTLAVADAAAPAVEGHEGHEQGLGEDLRRVGTGLPDAEATLDQGITRVPEMPAQVGDG